MLDTKQIESIDTNPAVVSLKSLRAEIKAAKEEMLNAVEGSKEYSNALQKAADKAFALREMQTQIRGTAADLGEILANSTRVLAGVASGFSAVQGSMALFGIENENLQKGLLKVQSAMAIAQGLEGLEGLGKNLTNLKIQLQQTVIGQKLFAAATWLMTAAMNANPIGLFIGLFVALGAAVYAVTKIFDNNAAAIKKENTALDGLVYTTKEAAEAHNEQLDVLRELDLEWQVAIGNISEYDKSLIVLADTNAKALAKIEEDSQKRLDNINGFWNSTWRIIKAGFTGETAIEQKRKELTDSAIQKNNEYFAQRKLNSDREFAIQLKEKQRLGDQLEDKKAYWADKNKIDDKGYSKQLEDFRKRGQDLINEEGDAGKRLAMMGISANTKELVELNLHHDRIIADVDKFNKELAAMGADLVLSKENIESEYQARVKELNTAIENEWRDKIAAAAEQDRQDLAADQERRDTFQQASVQSYMDAIEAEHQIAVADLEFKQYLLDEDVRISEARADIQFAYVNMLQITSDIAKVIGDKNTKVQKAALIVDKAIAIGQVWISNAVANAKAVAAFPLTGGLPWTAINTVTAGLQTALIIAQTAKALQGIGGDSSGGSSVPTGGSSVPTAPNILQQVTPTRNVLTNSEYNLQNQPLRAYVVETELTSVQNKVASTKREATY